MTGGQTHGVSVRFITCTLHHIQQDGKSGKCSIHEGHTDISIKFMLEDLKKREGREDNIKIYLEQWDGRYGLDSSYSQQGLAITSCGNSNYIVTR